MKFLSLPSTQARNQFFELVNAARYTGQVTIIMQSGKPVAQIVPVQKKKIDWKSFQKKLDAFSESFSEEDLKEIEQARDSVKNRFPDW